MISWMAYLGVVFLIVFMMSGDILGRFAGPCAALIALPLILVGFSPCNTLSEFYENMKSNKEEVQ
jgi:hypothetical protein